MGMSIDEGTTLEIGCSWDAGPQISIADPFFPPTHPYQPRG